MKNEFKLECSDLNFRLRQMNAIELLALRSTMSNKSFADAKTSFNTLLEMVEVQFDGQWMPVKEQNAEVYFPAGIENDVDVISSLIQYIMSTFILPVFQKSNASN